MRSAQSLLISGWDHSILILAMLSRSSPAQGSSVDTCHSLLFSGFYFPHVESEGVVKMATQAPFSLSSHLNSITSHRASLKCVKNVPSVISGTVLPLFLFFPVWPNKCAVWRPGTPLSEVTLHVLLWEGLAVEEFSSLNLHGSVWPEILSHPSVQAWVQRRLYCSV